MSALKKGEILEHRFVASLDTHYGVYKPDLDARLVKGDIAIAHLDIIGIRYMKEHYNATTFFIMPSSLDQLKSRIRAGHRAMTDEELEKRMEIARREIREDAPQCDYRIVNADGKLATAVDEVVAILRKDGYNLE